MAKKLLIVGLLLLLILLVIPMGIGMAMTPCPECSTPAPAAGMLLCLMMLVGTALFVSPFISSIELARWRPCRLLLVSMIERPPRFA